MRINPRKIRKILRRVWTAPKRIFETFLHSRTTRCIGMNATHITFIKFWKSNKGFFLYYISCKENKCRKILKIMRKLLFNYSFYSHPEIGNFRVWQWGDNLCDLEQAEDWFHCGREPFKWLVSRSRNVRCGNATSISMLGGSSLRFSPPSPNAAPAKDTMAAQRPSSHARYLSGPAHGETPREAVAMGQGTPTWVVSSSRHVKAPLDGFEQWRPSRASYDNTATCFRSRIIVTP
jgi:hypothetical protein